MSSINCINCQFRLWDKYAGLSKKVIEKPNGDLKCPKCKQIGFTAPVIEN